MAIGAFILGHSGSGKSFSLRNLSPDNVGFINVVGKFLPFKNAQFKQVITDNPHYICELLRKSVAPIIIIDDFQYLMSNQFMRDSDIKGYDKYTQNGKNIWQILNTINYEIKPNLKPLAKCWTRKLPLKAWWALSYKRILKMVITTLLPKTTDLLQ
jgi:hypothetical protein